MIFYMSNTRFAAALSAGVCIWIATWGYLDIGIRTNVAMAVVWALVALAPRDIKS